MKNAHDVVMNMMRTEKGSGLQPQGKYIFKVHKDANKIAIKHAVEEIYKVKVDDVNTLSMKGKRKRVRYEMGKTADWKKAVVTLKEGEKIEITT